MTNSYTLGKNGKFGEIDFSKLRSGITKAELGIQEGSVLDSIWKSIDTNQEGDSKDRLDRQELNQLIKIVRELCGKDNNLSANETKNFKNNSDSTLSKKHKEELLTFLSKLSELTKDVAKVEAESNMETITYEDGHKEQVKPDGSKIIISKDGKTITEKDSDNNTTKETAKTDDGEIVTEYEQNSRNPKKQTITNKNSQSVILYANGKKIKQTTTLKENGEIQEYDYAEGQPILKRITNQKTGEALIYNKGKLASKTITTKTNQGTQVSNTVYDGDNLTESISLNGKERYQKKVIDGREYEVRYDENGNTTGVIVQNGESIKAIADKFGVDSKQLVKANAHLLKGGKHSFSAGDEIVIPRKMEADEYVSAQKGRKDAEGAKADYRAAAEQRAAAKRAQHSHSEKENTNSAKLYDWKGKKDQDWVYIQIKYAKGSTAEGIAKDLYKREGVANPSKEAVKARAKAILQAYSKYFDSKGVLRGTQRLSYRISKSTQEVEEIKHYNKNLKVIKAAESLAEQFYQIADENSGLNSMKKMQVLLDTKINSQNIVAFLDAYDREKTRRGDSSIIDTVTSEIGAGATKQQRKVLMTIMNKLCEAAKIVGVSASDIQKARIDFETSLNKEFAALRRTNPKEMEKAIDFLRGAIAAKQTSNVNSMSTKEARSSFNANFSEDNQVAQDAYNSAKGKEGWSWSAKTGDTICGWFGCNTIEEIETKLGKNARAVKWLASAKSDAEFKKRYKKVFGIEFDAQKIAATEAAQSNYIIALGLSQSIKSYNLLLKNSNIQTLSQFENSIKNKLKLNDNQFKVLKQELYKNCSSDKEKKIALNNYLNSANEELSTQYRKITRGKTLEQMRKDVQLITKSAFGTNDIGKDVAQFTENMATTEMVTDIAGDIALTVALSVVPGGAAWGAARMAATAAKWGAKGAKLAKVLKNTAVTFNKVKKFEQGRTWATKAKQGSTTAKIANSTSRVASSASNAAAGTVIYETSATNHSLEEIKEKCLTNGIYGALGAGAAELAPKLMQAFKINNALANELAEEIINATGSLGVEAAKGGEYGETDAIIDIVSGILMARLSHIGSSKTKAQKTEAVIQNSKTPQIAKDCPNEMPSSESIRNSNIANGETVKNSEQSHSNTQERANIDDGVEGTPTRENVDAYQRENAHQEATPEERIDINENNADIAEVKPKEETPDVETPHADAAEELIDSTAESYSEMNENELFAEYQRLNNEFKYGGLSQTEKASRVKELQKIQKELETKGFSIENDSLVSKSNNSSQNVNQTAEPEVNSTQLKAKLGEKLFAIYQGVERSIDSLKDISGYNKLKTLIANKFNNSPTEFSNLITRLNKKAKEIGLNIVETSVDRTARMGKSLSKFYTKIENAIDKMKDLERFNKLLDKITTRFATFKDDMKALLDKLYDKAQALGLSIKESIHDVYSRVGIKAEGVNPLDKYTRSKTGADMSKTHTEWFISRKNLFKDNHDYPGMVWSGYTPKDRHHGAWKMHLYSVSEADWREMCDVIIPYLKDHDIDWKTYNSAHGADCLNGSKQQGKAFTIYPKNNEDMAQIAKDLDYIIRRNKLETSGSHIIGDNQMGSTGRLFYRYEFNSKEHMDVSPNSPDWNKYIQTDKYGRQIGGYYDANRGEGKYLASDMTDADDIWRNFDPSDPNALPIKIEKLRKGEPFEIYGSAKLNLANIVELDLNEPRIKALIDNLPEGGRLTIGREGDIRINDVSNKISRIHAIIEKHNGKIYVIDNSANGTRVRMEISSPQKQSQSSTNNSSKSEHAKAEPDPIREQACNKFDKNIQPVEMPENGVLDRNNQYLLNLNEPPALRLVDGTIVDLGRSDILDKIKNLQEGEFITLGRTGDITVSNSSNVSRHHILITKQNGQIQIKDVSSFANTRALSQAEREVRANAIRKFNKNQPLFEMPDNGMLNPDKNYFLDFADLPKLRLTDGTIIDLSSPKYYSAIRHLQEGRFITLGRTGFADIGISNSNTISRHHILITIQNGELILKDISSNGGTYRVGSSSQYENYSRDNNSRRSEGSSNAHNSNSASNNANKINDYKKLLDISEDTPLTKDVIKKAYRKKCLEWHPDRHPENEAECKVMMQKLNEAKEILDKLIPESS